MIARACRDPVCRRRAIRLLREFPIREGLWDSVVAARIAEHVMWLEEGAVGRAVQAATDIPPWARITEAATRVDLANRRVVIRSLRIGNNAAAGPSTSFETVVPFR